jgi:hypothetical protein
MRRRTAEDIPGLLLAMTVVAYKRHVQSGSTEAIDMESIDNPSLIGQLNNLGIFLGSRYKRTREVKDLDEAI